MKQKDNIIHGYNRTSQHYAQQFLHELHQKPLDQLLLARFVKDNQAKGPIGDLGCGPGQTTQYLASLGVSDLLGIDLSPGMVETARQASQGQIEFTVGNMLDLEFPDAHFGSMLAFYAIVHLTHAELAQALQEIRRVTKPGGQFLLAFHVGQETNSVTEFLGQEVEMAFYYFEVEKVLKLAQKAGWEVVEVVERHPYEGRELPSRRAYITLG
jgi:ubiquinone/menaquinone biosynthesis C-methylase UbiE